MAVTVAQFRLDFPEFGNVGRFPDSRIAFYVNLAGKLLSADRWADVLDEGTELFTAHNVALAARAAADASTGGIPGVATGPVSAKSIDKVSVNYDTASAMEPDAGHWNYTVYGQQFIHLARMMGAGPVQVGIGGCAGPLSSAAAWSGPNCLPGWLGS